MARKIILFFMRCAFFLLSALATIVIYYSNTLSHQIKIIVAAIFTFFCIYYILKYPHKTLNACLWSTWIESISLQRVLNFIIC